MITQTNYRNNGGTVCEPSGGPRAQADAIESLLMYEIGYGGRITKIEPTEVHVRTHIMSCVDDTVYSGSEEEMEPLVHIAVLAAKYHAMDVESSREEAMNKVMEVTKGNPLLIKLGGDILIGGFSVRNVIAAMCGFENNLNKAQGIATKDLLCAGLMAYNKECTLDEALELARAQPVFDSTGKVKGLENPS